jgi:hypothetical protein
MANKTRRARRDPRRPRTRRLKRQLKQKGGDYPVDQLPGAIKERIDSSPPNGRVIQLDKSDPYFNPPLPYNPEDKIKVQDMDERLYDINDALRATLHIFNPADPLLIKDSTTFAAKLAERRDPNDTTIADAMQYLLDLENELRTLAGATVITDKNLANQSHYPLYLWFIAAPDLAPPADGRRPLPLGKDAIDEVLRTRVI